MKRVLANLALGTSFIVVALVCLLAIRAQSGSDTVSLTWFRYMPDKSVRSAELHLTSDYRGLALGMGVGHVGPFNGQLVWGYHVNADQSRGLPQLHIRHSPYDGLMGFMKERDEKNRPPLPLSAYVSTRTKAVNGDDSVYLHLGVSFGFLAFLFSVPPIWKLSRILSRA